MLIGYARCSTADQNLDWQLDALKKNGCERIYQEKVTGTKKERPELNRMLEALRDGDTVIVCELTRLSRSTKDLFELVERINGCGADVKSLKEAWLDTTTPHGKLLFTISAGISQFERDLTHERLSLVSSQTMTVSPSRSASSILFSSGRSFLVPVTFS